MKVESSNISVKPEDVLRENENYAEFNGAKVRKGTIAAAIANAKLYLEDHNNVGALQQLMRLKGDLKKVGLYDVLSWKDKELRDLLQQD